MKSKTSWNRKDLDVEFIRKSYIEDKMSASEISIILKTSHNTILKRLRELGLTTRNKTEVMNCDRVKKLISQKHTGKKLSPEACKAISEGHKGLPRSEEHNRKIGEAQKWRTQTPEQRKHLSLYRKQYLNDHPEERQRLRDNRAKQIFPLRDSKIEVKLQNLLKEIGVNFYCHYFVDISDSYQCDIYIPIQKGINHKIILEADGDYWHGNPAIYSDWNQLNLKQKLQKIKDFERTNQLEEKGYKVIRIWESDIKDLTKPELEVMLK